MCVFRRPKLPAPDPAVEAERKERIESELATTKANKQDALQKAVKSKKKGGSATHSLLSSSGGGIGFYNDYMSG
jgi:hypothetical protein